MNQPHSDKAFSPQRPAATANSATAGVVSSASSHVPPAPPSPHVLVGVQHLQQGRRDLAEASFQAALAENASDPLALNCLGIIAKQQANLELASAFFSLALIARPDFAEALSNQGNVLREQGQWPAAIAKYEAALRHKPTLPDAYNGLGVARMALGDLLAAVTAFEAAVQFNPRSAEAFNNLGNALRELGREAEAVAAFQAALQLAPGSAEIHNNLAIAFREQGDLLMARQHCERAVQLNGQFSEAWGNLAACLSPLGEISQATDCLRRAVSFQPRSVSLLTSLFNLLRQQDLTDEAVTVADQLCRVEPDSLAHVVRRSAIWPPVFSSSAAMDEFANATLARWRQQATCPWPVRAAVNTDELPACEPPFNLQFMAGNVRPWKEAYARWMQPQLERRYPDLFQPLELRRGRADGRLRVGVVVTRGHEGIFLKSMKGVLQRLDAEQFDVIVFCPQATCTRVRDEFATLRPTSASTLGPDGRSIGATPFAAQSSSLQVLPLPTRFRPAAERIRDAACDLLLYWEVGTDEMNYFLPFLRLAPRQATSWGVQVTSGIPNVDYYFSSWLVEPADAAAHYSEKMICGDTLLTFQSPAALPLALRSRSEFGFSPQQHLYVCAQQLGKFHPDFDPLLANILRQDADATIVVTGDRTGQLAAHLRQRWERSLADVSDRIVCVPRLDAAAYLSLLAAADVLLDPPHFGGVNSTYDGLSLGKPIITWPQAFHRSRYTHGCYQLLGVADCIAQSADDYVQRAVAMGKDADLRRELETRLLAARPRLFENSDAIAETERLFRLAGNF